MRSFIVVGLGFGDEGKGSMVDFLVRRERAGLVVRFAGGPQAAHHVVTTDGMTHCFAQFGAGTLVPGVRTHLGRRMLVDPLALGAEEAALRRIGVGDGYSRLSIDPRCLLVTPFHWLANRIEELARGAGRHGSCGRGIAEAQLDAERGLPSVRMADARDPASLLRALLLIWRMKLDRAEQLRDRFAGGAEDRARLASLVEDLRRPDRPAALVEAYAGFVAHSGVRLRKDAPPSAVTVLEGAQGVLLDRHHGFWPHVTPSRSTFEDALELLDDGAMQQVAAEVVRVGVLRAYTTRHGAGPLPTEDAALTAACPDVHNGLDPWQGAFRLGSFDAVLGRYALSVVGGVDVLALTNLDRVRGALPLRVCTGYEDAGREVPRLPLSILPPSEIAARVALTAQLARARPIYRQLPAGASEEDYLALIEAELERPVDLVSRGPTAADKSERTRTRRT